MEAFWKKVVSWFSLIIIAILFVFFIGVWLGLVWGGNYEKRCTFQLIM